MISGLMRTPRPAPGRILPLASGALVILLALPVFLLGGWRIAGWGLAAALWIGGELFGMLLARLPVSGSNLTRAGVVAFGMMFRAIAIMVVLIAIAVSDSRLALSAAVVYALAYSFELGISMIAYFGSEAT